MATIQLMANLDTLGCGRNDSGTTESLNMADRRWQPVGQVGRVGWPASGLLVLRHARRTCSCVRMRASEKRTVSPADFGLRFAWGVLHPVGFCWWPDIGA